MLRCIKKRDSWILLCLRYCVLGERFRDEVAALCTHGVNLFREDNDVVLADGGFPILALEDERGCVCTAASTVTKMSISWCTPATLTRFRASILKDCSRSAGEDFRIMPKSHEPALERNERN